MKKYVIIKADYNDADYVTEQSLVDDDDIELIKKVAECIKLKNNKWNTFYRREKDYPQNTYKDVLTEKEVERFNQFVPNGGDYEGGIHTIESIKIITVADEEILLGWF